MPAAWNNRLAHAYTSPYPCLPPMPRPGKLFSRLLALFLVVPIVELVLLVWLGGQIGFWPTAGLIALTALAGTWLAQREGLSVWQRFQARVASGGMPGRELTDGLIILVSGAFLLTPGVLTDVVGLLGLLPPTRALIRRELTRRAQRGIANGSVRMFSFGPAGAAPFGQSPAGQPPPPDAAGPRADEDVVDVHFEEFERPRRR
jgi:UPF0716 protein FxsA